jgi:TfoX/Sxy family transcriptional regulator of competence genes
MVFDESVAARVRKALGRRKNITERKMFGGVAFLLDGNMCCGVLRDVLVLRLGTQGASEALREPHARPMDFTGKPMKSMIYVDPAGFSSDAALREWLRRALAFASELPVKG